MRTPRKSSETKLVSEAKNCFLFDEESPKSGNDTSSLSTMTDRFKVTEFRADKPYRLSLYVHPSAKRKVSAWDSKIIANLTQIRQNRDKENKHKRIRTTKATKENVNVTLFDEENDATKYEKKTRKLADKSTDGEKPSKVPKKGILAYININESTKKKPTDEEIESTLSKTKPKKVQREYTKRNKENTNARKIADPHSEDDDMEQTDSERARKSNSDFNEEKNTKKIVKSKDKEEEKGDEEFEKWAESMNSDFDEIDKFELSITYD